MKGTSLFLVNESTIFLPEAMKRRKKKVEESVGPCPIRPLLLAFWLTSEMNLRLLGSCLPLLYVY